jgi:hypothetical protein
VFKPHPTLPTAHHAGDAEPATGIDPIKATNRSMVIGDVKLLEKHGGKSGSWVA